MSEYVKIQIGNNTDRGIVRAEFRAKGEVLEILKDIVKQYVELSFENRFH